MRDTLMGRLVYGVGWVMMIMGFIDNRPVWGPVGVFFGLVFVVISFGNHALRPDEEKVI